MLLPLAAAVSCLQSDFKDTDSVLNVALYYSKTLGSHAASSKTGMSAYRLPAPEVVERTVQDIVRILAPERIIVKELPAPASSAPASGAAAADSKAAAAKAH